MLCIVRSAVGSLASLGWLQIFKEHLGLSIIGIDIKEDFFSKNLLDAFYKVPLANEENEKELMGIIYSIIQKYKPKWIISGPENEIKIFTKYKAELMKINVNLFHPPLKTIEVITDKINLFNFLRNYIKLPKTVNVINYNDIQSNKIILKKRKGRGSTDILNIHKSDISHLLNTSLILEQDYIAQEYIEGDEYTVDILCDIEGKPLNIIPRKRIEVDSGISVITQTEKNPILIKLSHKITKMLEFNGVFCIQFIRKGNTYYLTDINPRFGGGSIISWYASKSFRKNLKFLLQEEYDNLNYSNVDEYDEIKLLRSYCERIELV